ncbi:hypothetical protein QBC44DRAFT_368436 [Cladorrhinum sp. PSN332]|nr:hypothetical protein QBC44DRAFT_368436 [Cladorrhinum sp. PSN332]
MARRHVFKYRRAVEATRTDLPREIPCVHAIPSKLGLLQFWTFATKLPLGGAALRGGSWVNILDCDGVICGTVNLNFSSSSRFKPWDEYELLLLSESPVREDVEVSFYLKDKRRKKSWTVRDAARRVVDTSLHVLLVSWNGPLAERVGSGTIFQEALNFLGDYGLVWKEIILA